MTSTSEEKRLSFEAYELHFVKRIRSRPKSQWNVGRGRVGIVNNNNYVTHFHTLLAQGEERVSEISKARDHRNHQPRHI